MWGWGVGGRGEVGWVGVRGRGKGWVGVRGRGEGEGGGRGGGGVEDECRVRVSCHWCSFPNRLHEWLGTSGEGLYYNER